MLKSSFLEYGSMRIAMVTGPSQLPAERLLYPQDGPFSLELVIVTIQPLASELNSRCTLETPRFKLQDAFFQANS